MLELQGINIWAVALVWLIYMFIGAFWYSPMGFAKLWTKYTKIDILKIPTNEANKIIGFVALSALVQASALAIVLNSLGVNDVYEGVKAGLVLWLGFTAATTVGVTLYSRRSWKFLWLNSSYFLVVMTIGSIILSIWQ
ncbi:MAG: DUF1761 domain-containing protein [Candidatus Saccharibacteria bacterium]|nr:DUF1761 domain-containing protein [Candidatus Saccharibacteria bacterium]